MTSIALRANADQFRELTNDGLTRELLSGVVLVRESPSAAHEIVLSRLHALLSSYAEERDLGAVFRHPWPVELSKLDVVRPDLYFLTWRDGAIGTDGVRGTPELVVEVVSPESRERDLGEKLRLYAWAGVREYWIVDPETRSLIARKKGRQGFEDLPTRPPHFRSDLLLDLTVGLAVLFED
jgi:Uma2 family endonuclease